MNLLSNREGIMSKFFRNGFSITKPTIFNVIVVTMAVVVIMISVYVVLDDQTEPQKSTTTSVNEVVKPSKADAITLPASKEGVRQQSVATDSKADMVISSLLVLIIIMQGVLLWHLWHVKKIQSFRKNSESGILLFPETLEKELADDVAKIDKDLIIISRELMSAFKLLGEKLDGDSKISRHALDTVQDETAKIREILGLYQQEVGKKDKEIDRLRMGYDAYVVDKFSERIAKIRSLFIEEISYNTDETVTRVLKEVLEIVDDALEGVGIESFEPVVGEPYRTAYGVDDHYKKIPTENQDDHGKIASVEVPGLRVVSATKEYRGPIRKALVSVYVSQSPVENTTEGGEG